MKGAFMTLTELENLDYKSSVFEKVPPDVLEKIDAAFADRSHVSVVDVYDEFELINYQVSRSAFYRYARRVRVRSAHLNLADLLPLDVPDPGELLQRAIALRLMVALDSDTKPRNILRLAHSWRIASGVLLARRRTEAILKAHE